MLAKHSLLLPLYANMAMAAHLFVTHYTGSLTSLAFNGTDLKLINSMPSGNIAPSWVTYDHACKTLYVSDEVNANQTTASLLSYHVGQNSTLQLSGNSSGPLGTVMTALYGGADGKGFIAQAHYGSSQLSTFKLPLDGSAPLQTIAYNSNATLGPVSHPHQVLVDPTKQYMVVPDLGADMIRIYKIDQSSGNLTECPGAPTPTGTGPRHAAFWTAAGGYSRIAKGTNSTMLYVVNELANSVTGWTVTYPAGGCMKLDVIQSINPFEGNNVNGTANHKSYLSEIRVKNNFVYVANRNDTSFDPADSLSEFTISPNGTLAFSALSSSYGHYPRTFDINPAGTFVAIGNQFTANVAIVKRDPITGKLGERVADMYVGPEGSPLKGDGLSAVIWA